MSSTNLPQFSDPKLQKVARESASKVESFKGNLDAISADIKALESWLQGQGVCVSCALTFQEDVVLLEPWLDEINKFYSGSAQRITEKLRWGEDKQSGKWRILYVRLVAEGNVQIDEGFPEHAFEQAEQVEERPLIECPIAVRLRAHKKLPDFLSELSEHIKVERIVMPA